MATLNEVQQKLKAPKTDLPKIDEDSGETPKLENPEDTNGESDEETT